MAESFYAFLQNITVAMTGVTRGAAAVSLPRSQVEMTDWDWQWQDKITKVIRRVAKDLIAMDEAEIGEVVRRRLKIWAMPRCGGASPRLLPSGVLSGGRSCRPNGWRWTRPPPKPKRASFCRAALRRAIPLQPSQARQLRLFGALPPETWNRLGTRLIPKLRAGQDLKVEVRFTLKVGADASQSLVAELCQILSDLGISDQIKIEVD